MLLVLGDREFDVTHRALVVGYVGPGETARIEDLQADGPVAVVVASSSDRDDVCERVRVPVGVVVSPDQVEFAGASAVGSVGPFSEAESTRIASVTASLLDGARVVLSTSVQSDRRVAEVIARLLEARDLG